MLCLRVDLIVLVVGLPTAGAMRMNLGGDPDLQLGEQYGNALAEQISAGGTEMSGAIANGFRSDERVLVNPNVSKVILEANRLAESVALDRDAVCERNWDASCPDGWAAMANGMCRAPVAYNGPCPFLQSFMKYSTGDKLKFAANCHAPWPCAADNCNGGKDYDVECPAGWEPIGDGFCQAPTPISLKCADVYKFDDMGVDQKQELAIACGIDWNCREQCEQDYSKPCPEGWVAVEHNPGYCLAPAAYVGACPFIANTAGMTNAQKEAFADKCSVTFRCR